MSGSAELRPPAALFLAVAAACAAGLPAAVALTVYAIDSSASGNETAAPAPSAGADAVQAPRAGVSDRPAVARDRMAGRIDPEGHTDSRVCGGCHVDIYRSWRNSMHALSLSDPIFDAAYMQALKLEGEDAKRLCLRCHAPLTQVNADYDLKLGVTREGVTCDFCHTVTAVHLDGRDIPYSTAPGLTKRSVLRNAESPAHEVAYSELHGTAEFCGGCHNYVTPGGVTLMSTYDEWRLGPYAQEGVQCQDCHMVLSPGRVARAGLKSSGTSFHLHDLIHDADQLRGALSVEIVSARRTARGLEVEVAVENVGSGHCVPTGLPTREVILTVQADSGRLHLVLDRRYRKLVGDAQGRELATDAEAFLFAATMLDDNRIKPRERRRERFVFALPPSGKATVRARLSYVYSPMILKKEELNIKLGEVERVVY